MVRGSIYLEPAWHLFGWKKGLVLEGWPSKIKDFWALGIFQSIRSWFGIFLLFETYCIPGSTTKAIAGIPAFRWNGTGVGLGRCSVTHHQRRFAELYSVEDSKSHAVEELLVLIRTGRRCLKMPSSHWNHCRIFLQALLTITSHHPTCGWLDESESFLSKAL